MKELLLILPLLIFISCEEIKDLIFSDDGEDDFFNNEWVECKILSIKDIDADGNITRDILHDWSGNSEVFYYNAEAQIYFEFNDYGIMTYRESYYNGRKSYYEIFDKWKLLTHTSTDSLGDTLSYIEFSWDGLTSESSGFNSDNDLIIRTNKYNIYGRLLEQFSTNTNSGDISSVYTLEYKEDGRRLDNYQYSNSSCEVTWSGNSFEALYYNDGQLQSKSIGEINEYYQETWSDWYEYINDSWVFMFTTEYEMTCPGFEQIYP